MGRPFQDELSKISTTIVWATGQPVDSLAEALSRYPNTPLYIVGSGGSLSACYFAAALYQKKGIMAKAITPLELHYSKEALKKSNILFISSSGRNNDILFGFNVAVHQEPQHIISITMRKNTPLGKLAENYSIASSFEFNIPSKKDGFLATNTLVAYFVLLCKSFGFTGHILKDINDTNNSISVVNDFVNNLTPDHTLTVLYGGWGQSVAYDIESKFTEAALGNVLLTDYRNFGHGRHHWFAKRKKSSAIVALISPEEKRIAEKTLSLIPSDIPRLILESTAASPLAAVELLVKSFYLTGAFGAKQNIDPGRPGVPDFGRKLYHLKYSSFYAEKPNKQLSERDQIAILRKTRTVDISLLSSEEIIYWKNHLNLFRDKINKTQFGSIVFDYDGTLCSASRRYDGLAPQMVEELCRLLEKGIVVGIATGRGQSVRIDLANAIPKSLHKNIVVGYYNGSDIGLLSDTSRPDKDSGVSEGLSTVKKLLDTLRIPFTNLEITLRPNQITIEVKDKSRWEKVKGQIQNVIMGLSLTEQLQIVESSHSIDVIAKSKASKLNVIDFCLELSKNNKMRGQCLCIGDKGQWPGNDFELLSTPYSLSTNETSLAPDSCWNLAPIGHKDADATIFYLKKLITNKYFFNIEI